MSFIVNKIKAGITNNTKLHATIDADAKINASIKSVVIDDFGNIIFVFSGDAGELTALENFQLDSILDNFDNSESNLSSVNDATPRAVRVENSGRIYCYADDRWVTPNDDLYGASYFQWAESAGTNSSTPICEWEHGGHYVTQGETIKNFKLIGRANSSSVIELTYFLMFRRPDSAARWASGYDSDKEMINTTILYDKWNNNSSAIAFSGSIADMHRRTHSNIDYTFPEDGFLTIYFKPTNTSNNTRYFYATYQIDLEI